MQEKTLLLVDDEKGILRALRRLFRKSDLRLLIADSGEEALEILAEHDVQVILTDFRMPGITGGQLLESASAKYPETVGMILSGYAELKAILATFDKGVVYKFLTKPWDDANLLTEVERAFEISSQKAIELDPASVPPIADLHSEQGRVDPSLEAMLNREGFAQQVRASLDEGATGFMAVLDLEDGRRQIKVLGLESTLEMLSRVTKEAKQLSHLGKVCHWGGNRFLLWMPEASGDVVTTLSQASSKVSSDLQSASDLFRVGVTASRPGVPFETLILEAQAARFSASENQTVQLFSSDMAEMINKEEAQLAEAIANGGLSLVYQPVADSDTNRVVALEALVRADLLASSESSDAMMIPVSADNLGLTEAYARWLVETAVHDLAEFEKTTGFTGKLVLNLSLWQLESSKLIGCLEKTLESAGLSADRLQVDLSENLLINRRPICKDNLRRLEALGVELILDDQGTAYSLLKSDISLPVKRVKIDRSFLRSLLQLPSQQEMLVHLCEVIESRGLAVSVEGLESREQMEFLQKRFSFQYQGFVLSKALHKTQINEWLAQHMSSNP